MDNINKDLENQQGASENPVNKDERVIPPAYPDAPEWTKNILISSTPWPSPEEIGKAPVKLNEPEKITYAAEMAEPEAQPYEDMSEKKELPMWLQIGIIAVAAVVLLIMVRGVMNLRKSPETTVPVTDSAVTVTATDTA
ncbi:MAG: hypothetical protein IKV21_04550, partial [Clostridia bacterium]|nr:hypothetical protein [Clostridia bacterium]